MVDKTNGSKAAGRRGKPAAKGGPRHLRTLRDGEIDATTKAIMARAAELEDDGDVFPTPEALERKGVLSLSSAYRHQEALAAVQEAWRLRNPGVAPPKRTGVRHREPSQSEVQLARKEADDRAEHAILQRDASDRRGRRHAEENERLRRINERLARGIVDLLVRRDPSSSDQGRTGSSDPDPAPPPPPPERP